jgi:hypothetical protein
VYFYERKPSLGEYLIGICSYTTGNDISYIFGSHGCLSVFKLFLRGFLGLIPHKNSL